METLTVLLSKCDPAPDYPVLVLPYQDTSEQVAKAASSMTCSWDCTTIPLNSTDYGTLYTFFQARGGGLQAFLWTPPLPHVQTQYTVRIVAGSFKPAVTSVSWMVTSFQLRKVAP